MPWTLLLNDNDVTLTISKKEMFYFQPVQSTLMRAKALGKDGRHNVVSSNGKSHSQYQYLTGYNIVGFFF